MKIGAPKFVSKNYIAYCKGNNSGWVFNVHDAIRGTVRVETRTKGIPKCFVYLAPDDGLETEGTKLFYYYLIPCCEESSVNVHSYNCAYYYNVRCLTISTWERKLGVVIFAIFIHSVIVI